MALQKAFHVLERQAKNWLWVRDTEPISLSILSAMFFLSTLYVFCGFFFKFSPERSNIWIIVCVSNFFFFFLTSAWAFTHYEFSWNSFQIIIFYLVNLYGWNSHIFKYFAQFFLVLFIVFKSNFQWLSGVGYCDLKTDQRTLFLALQNLLHLQKE